MELTRQEFLRFGAGAAVASLLGGCGSSGGGAGTTNLTFWNGFTGGDGPQMLALVDAFTKERGDVSVDMVTVRWEDYYQKLPAAVDAGKGPDVGIMQVDQIATNAAHGVVRPLDDLVADLGLREEDFAEEVWQAGAYEGKRYGVPLDMHPLGLFYNKAVLKEAGIDAGAIPSDREGFESMLEELKGKGVKGNWTSPYFFTGGLMFQSLLYQFGGQLTDAEGKRAQWNSDAGVEAVDYLRSLVKRGYSPPNIAQDADNIAFKGGQTAFIWQGSWGIADYSATDDLEWGAAPLPTIGSRPAAWSNSHNFVVMSTTPEAKLEPAQAMIDSITRSPAWAEAGQVPARKAARESEAFAKLEAQSQLAKQVPNLRFPPPVPGGSDVRESTLDIALQQALSGARSPREALDDSAGRANELLRENREKFRA